MRLFNILKNRVTGVQPRLADGDSGGNGPQSASGRNGVGLALGDRESDSGGFNLKRVGDRLALFPDVWLPAWMRESAA